jgi:hypothetical protein
VFLHVWLRWFVALSFVVGSGLFFVGLYLMGVRDDWLGANVLLAGVVLLLVVLVVAVFYAAGVRVKILRDASKF